MNRTVLVLSIGLLSATMACAQTGATPLIVVQDRGGVSALPYYKGLNRQDTGPARPDASAPSPGASGPVDSDAAEASMLPVRSTLLSPGDVPRRSIRAPGLRPLFLIGDDARSRAWLCERSGALRELRAVGMVVNVSSPAALAALRGLVPGLVLAPVSGDDLARRLGLRHYPVLLTATAIGQ